MACFPSDKLWEAFSLADIFPGRTTPKKKLVLGVGSKAWGEKCGQTELGSDPNSSKHQLFNRWRQWSVPKYAFLLPSFENREWDITFQVGTLFPKPFEFRCGQIIMYSQRNVSGSGIWNISIPSLKEITSPSWLVCIHSDGLIHWCDPEEPTLIRPMSTAM